MAKISDNKDPDNLHRVKFTFNDEAEVVSDWSPCISFSAGNDTGFYSLPDIDEQVIVISLDDSNTKFAVLGSIWSDEVKPPETKENSDADLNGDGNNSIQFIKSKKGNMLIFDDTDSKEKIQLITSDGKSRIEFSQADELINIDTENDIQLNAKSNIEINAEELNVTASKQVSIKADDFQIKSSKDMTINSDKDITIKGSGVALN